jgi:hypothetical protein
MLGVSSPLAAQDTSVASIAYPLHQRVRVVAPTLSPKPIVGRVASVDSLRLALTVTSKGSILDMPLADVTTLSGSGGIDRARGAKRGALVGLALGGWFFADTSRGDFREGDYFGVGALATGFVSFLVTPAIAALAGYGLAPERWEALPLRKAAAPVRSAAAIRFTPGEDVRLTANGRKVSGRVASQTSDLLALETDDGQTSVRWRDVTALTVRGEKSRRRGAVRGAIIITGITAIGIATDPLPTAAENVGVVIGNAAFGALIGAFFPMRSRTSLPVPR